MLTMQEWEQKFYDGKENFRFFNSSFRDDVSLLKAIHHDALMSHNDPQKTIDEFVDSIGYERAVEIIASMTNARAKWDGRISSKNAEWAREHALLDREVVIRLGGYADDVIHSCHLDQLCSYLRRKVV